VVVEILVRQEEMVLLETPEGLEQLDLLDLLEVMVPAKLDQPELPVLADLLDLLDLPGLLGLLVPVGKLELLVPQDPPELLAVLVEHAQLTNVSLTTEVVNSFVSTLTTVITVPANQDTP